MNFPDLWRAYAPDLPQPQAEYRFHTERRWRFDFAFPDPCHRLAIEFDGGQWVAHGGRHNRDSDRDKLNTAAVMGWRVLRFSNQQWEREPYQCLYDVYLALVGSAATP